MNLRRLSGKRLAAHYLAEFYRMQAERDRYIRAFNRLEKAVTNHVGRDCIDSDELAHVQKAVLRDLHTREESA